MSYLTNPASKSNYSASDNLKLDTITFVQFSDNLLTPESTMRDYYRQAYAKLDGYYYPEHFMEIPYWIALISGMLPSDRYKQSLYIAEDVDKATNVLGSSTQSQALLFSVMDANAPQIFELAQKIDSRMILGGYTDPEFFRAFKHIDYLESVNALAQILELNPHQPPNYELFNGYKCIPRLSLSTGCEFRCTFCTVPTTLTLSSPGDVKRQVESFRPLDFKLIFLDDKSFGQASNWRTLEKVTKQIHEYNKQFLGFIVQTPPSLALKNNLLELSSELGIKYMELGVEIVNDHYLERFNKPFRVRHLEEVCDRARSTGIKIIPNIILGIPDQDYSDTMMWVERNRDIIPVVNVNYLAVHHGNERGQLPWLGVTKGDRDQNTAEKSWLSPHETMRMKAILEELYKITST